MLSIANKIALLIIIFVITLGYSVYKKKNIDRIFVNKDYLILKELPEFYLKGINISKFLTRDSVYKNNAKGVFVHFWATWCAPCEEELPSFLKFAKKLKDKRINFLLISIDSEEKKVRKFIKRFDKLISANIFIALDPQGELMSKFGTVKIPETYIFNTSYTNINKFIGPQNWSSSYFIDNVDKIIN